MPLRPENVSARAPAWTPMRVISARQRVISPASELWPRLSPRRRRRRWRNVLQRATELDAQEVGRAVGAEAGLVQDGLEFLREFLVRGGDGADSGQAGDDLAREGRAGERADAGLAPDVGDDLADPLAGGDLKALAETEDWRVGGVKRLSVSRTCWTGSAIRT